MEKLIITSNYQELKHFLEENKDCHYYYVTIVDWYDEIEKLLNEKKCKKIDVDKIKSKIFPDFHKDYINFIGDLSREYNSIYWWANSISAKNIYITNFHLIIYYYCLIVNIFKKLEYENIILISDNKPLNNYIKKYCKEHNIYFEILNEKRDIETSNWVRENISFFKNVFRFIFDGWRKKYITSKQLKGRIESELRKDKEYYVLRTWLDKRSFPSPSQYNDVYFGKLTQYLTDNNVDSIILGGVPTDQYYKKMVDAVSKYNEMLIVLQDYCVKYIDYISAAILAYTHKIKIKKPLFFKDVDVWYLINTQLEKYHKYEIVTNLVHFFYIRRLARKIKIHTFTFPFENQSWEKITVLALRKYSPNTKIIGYQHSRVEKALLYYFPGEAERDITPIPDKIITVGIEPRQILEKYGNYREGVVKEGCALRYEYLFNTDIIERNRTHNILVALPLSMAESIRVITFLHKSLGDDTKYTVRFRSHPLLPFENIKDRLDFALSDNFQASADISLEEDLRRSDILIYKLTTVCFESLMMGVPVIHIDLGEPINDDPLFGCEHLKWAARNGEELTRAINEVYNLSDEEYKKQQRLARKYIESYFLSVTDNRMEEFIKV